MESDGDSSRPSISFWRPPAKAGYAAAQHCSPSSITQHLVSTRARRTLDLSSLTVYNAFLHSPNPHSKAMPPRRRQKSAPSIPSPYPDWIYRVLLGVLDRSQRHACAQNGSVVISTAPRVLRLAKYLLSNPCVQCLGARASPFAYAASALCSLCLRMHECQGVFS